MKWNELKDKSVEDLQDELMELRATQMKLRMQHATQQLEQTHQIRQVRKDIARIKTLLAQKKVKV